MIYNLMCDGLKRDPYPKIHHYPSDALSCKRKQYYDWIGEPKSDPIDNSGLVKMEIGNRLHDMVTQLMAKAVKIETEVPVKYKHEKLKHEISGRIDAVVDGIGIEIKTTYGYGAKSIQNYGPKPEHLAQVALYAMMTKLKKFIIFYLCRDNAYPMQYDLDSNLLPLTDDLIDRWIDVERHLLLSVPPDREFTLQIKDGQIKDKITVGGVVKKTDWQCQYCAYKTACWGIFSG